MSLLCRRCLLRQFSWSQTELRHSRIALRTFSVLNRPQPNYDGHVPLTAVERLALGVGSSVMAYLNPRRGGSYLVTLSIRVDR
jgi:ubiquinone biosynthesis protein COQ4